MTSIEFSEYHVDALTEFMNIAAGQVTAAIAQLLNVEGTMHIPKITLCTLAEMESVIVANIDPNISQYTSKQLFYGKMSGESLFILDKDSAITLNRELYDIETPSETDIIDGVSELANIIGATMLSRLANELGTPMSFTAPVIQLIAPKEMCLKDAYSQYAQVIIISTRLEFALGSINGFIYILTEDEMIQNLKSLIDVKLEELGL